MAAAHCSIPIARNVVLNSRLTSTALALARGRRITPMKSLKFAALGLAMAFAATGCAGAMHGSNMASHRMSASDGTLMSSCVAMNETDRMGNAECTALMHRMGMSNADMTTMASCHAMSHEDMMRNQ